MHRPPEGSQGFIGPLRGPGSCQHCDVKFRELKKSPYPSPCSPSQVKLLDYVGRFVLTLYNYTYINITFKITFQKLNGFSFVNLKS